jgi:glutamate-1-semialdehyde 2,1-aminomutase
VTSGRAAALIDSVRADLWRSRPRSAAAHESAMTRRTIGSTRSRFWPVPLYVERAEGAYLYDIDGFRYIDCNMGHGPLILGHRPPAVVAALAQQIRQGNHYGPPSSKESALAELIVAGVPGAEMLAFTNSGGESAMAAVRLARAATGRERVAKCEGGMHGNYEPLLFNVFSISGEAVRPQSMADCAGLPDGVAGDVVILPFNDDRAFDLVREHGSELACVIVEPLQGSAGTFPAASSFLEGLRAVCDEVGALLVFDEVITGFRLAPGSAALNLGVRPDLVTMGKAIGGGLPVGAVIGRRGLVMLTDSPPGGGFHEQVFVGGTFSGNPMTAAAGYAQLAQLVEDSSLYDRLSALGERMRSGLREALSDCSIAGFVTGEGSIWGGPYFMDWEPASIRDLVHCNQAAGSLLSTCLLEHGVLMTAPAHLNFLSTAHTEEDVDRVVEAHHEVLKLLQSEGCLE